MIGDIKFREVSESDIEYLMADESEFKPPTFWEGDETIEADVSNWRETLFKQSKLEKMKADI